MWNVLWEVRIMELCSIRSNIPNIYDILTMNLSMPSIEAERTKPNTKIFISGKVTGDPNYKEKFDLVEIYLKSLGYRVMNPAVLPVDFGVNECMSITIAMLSQCDAIYMLKDWKDSRGATIEHDFAKYAGKKIIYE